MKSNTLLLLLLMLVCAGSYPINDQPTLFIQSNASPEDAKNYQITIEKDAKPGDPCLTISWKTNPDGSEPDEPRIYLVNGYFQIMPPPANKQQ